MINRNHFYRKFLNFYDVIKNYLFPPLPLPLPLPFPLLLTDGSVTSSLDSLTGSLHRSDSRFFERGVVLIRVPKFMKQLLKRKICIQRFILLEMF